MTIPESKSETPTGIPELITQVEAALEGVKAVVDNAQYTNRDLVALTVEVETLREDLGTTLTKEESEARKAGLTVAFVGGIVVAVQATDSHVESCRVAPIINRFKEHPGLTPTQEFICNAAFPSHNHGEFSEVGEGLHPGNYVGIVLYAVVGLGLAYWWLRARKKAKKAKKARTQRETMARETARTIYNGPMHSQTKGIVKDVGPEEEAQGTS